MTIFWKDHKFHKVSTLYSTIDETFSDISKLIFPSEMEGEAPYIIEYTSSVQEEFNKNSDEEKLFYKTTKVFYIWDGKKLSLADKDDIEHISLKQ